MLCTSLDLDFGFLLNLLQGEHFKTGLDPPLGHLQKAFLESLVAGAEDLGNKAQPDIHKESGLIPPVLQVFLFLPLPDHSMVWLLAKLGIVRCAEWG